MVTPEPFYVNQHWTMRSHLTAAEFPVGVISIEELEYLVTLDAEELAVALIADSDAARDNVMILNGVLSVSDERGRTNRLIDETFNGMGLFARVDAAEARRAHSGAVQELASGRVDAI